MPNVVPHNQLVYVRLAELGWDVKYVVPNRWRDEYTPDGFIPQALESVTGTFARVRIAVPGAVQRHFYITRPARWLRRWRPDVVFVELEPFSVVTLQWGFAAQRLGIPWGCQGDENLDRPFPLPAIAIRRWSMPRIDFFAARSPGGADILRHWGARSEVGIVPHTIPEWDRPQRPRPEGTPFTVGFAGRLVEAKGLRDLIRAVRRLDFPFRLLVVGDGPLREELEAADLRDGSLDLRTGILSAQMPELYAQMDLLVLPSRTTPTWAEQFGKVLCEALLCGTPVLGSDSGEIPWVIETSGGGRLFPEGDDAALAATIAELARDPAERNRLAEVGRAGVEKHFGPRVAARELDRLMRGALNVSGGREADPAHAEPAPARRTDGSACAIVVTRNRRELLSRCLTALREQRRPVQQVLVVDNASEDGTADMVQREFPEAVLLRLNDNVGGAGGFHRGLAWAHARGHEWLWVMDDDTIPVPDTLHSLLAGGDRAPGGVPLLLASAVRWKDERLHPMNLPVPRWRWRGRMAEGIARGLVLLRNATFVSTAVHRQAIDRFGLPEANYFLWGDDVEFTSRILRDERGYLVPESVVYHWTPKPHTAAATTDPNRFYFHARNSLWILRGSSLSTIERLDYARFYLRSLRRFEAAHRGDVRAASVLLRGIRDGLRGAVR